MKHVAPERQATQNVTLALPKDVLRKARLLAVEKGTSVSGLLTKVLTEIVSGDESYRLAREQALKTLARPRSLGTGGKAGWTREDLHAR